MDLNELLEELFEKYKQASAETSQKKFGELEKNLLSVCENYEEKDYFDHSILFTALMKVVFKSMQKHCDDVEDVAVCTSQLMIGLSNSLPELIKEKKGKNDDE